MELRRLAKQGPVSAFIVVAFVWSWAWWIPAVLAYLNVGEITPPMLLAALVGAYGPSVAAIAVTSATGGRAAVRDLVRALLVWRVRPRWYVVAILLCPAVALGALAMLGTLGLSDAAKIGAQVVSIPFVLITALPFGPLGEELGWRGYLLPRLQERYSALTSSLLVGAVWALWHAPLWWVPGAALPTWTPVSPAAVGLWGAGVMTVAVLFAWIYNNTGGSLFMMVLFHTMTNATGRVIMPLFKGQPDEFFVRVEVVERLLYAALAMAVILTLGWRSLRSARPIAERM